MTIIQYLTLNIRCLTALLAVLLLLCPQTAHALTVTDAVGWNLIR